MLVKRRELLVVLFLLLILCLLFFNPLFYGGVFYFRDIFQNHSPIKRLSSEIIRKGDFPLWNPHQSFGQPLLANPNYTNFHPINFLFFFFPFDLSFSLSIILHFFLAGFFFYLLARDLQLRLGSCLIGSFIFTLSGYILSLGNLYNALATTAWLPLTFLLFRRGIKRKSLSYLMGASFSFAIQFLGGEPVTVGITLLLLFIYSLYYLPSPKKHLRQRLRNLAYLAFMGLLALMLAMIQLLPFLRLLTSSQRWQGLTYFEVIKWSLNPLRLIELFIPQMLGNPTALYFKEFSGHSFFDGNYPFILSIYLGILPLLLALAALILQWKKETKFWAFLLGISLFLSFGHYLPFHRSLYNLIPLFKIFRYPIKFFVLVTFSLAMLAAFGVESLIYQKEGKQKSSLQQKKANYLIFFSLIFIFILILISIYAWMITSPSGFKEALGKTYLAGQHSEGWLQRAFQVLKAKFLRSLAFGFFSAIIICLMFSTRLKKGLKLLLVSSCILMDLLPIAMEINPTVERELYYQPPPVVQFLRQDEGYFRICRVKRPKNVILNLPDSSIKWGYYWDKLVLTQASAVLYKISYGFDINTDKLNSASYVKFVRFTNKQPNPLKSKLMGLGNVKYILSFKIIQDPHLFPVAELLTGSNVTLKIYQNLLCLPRVYLAEKAVLVTEEDEALSRMLQHDFNPQQMVLLTEKYKGGKKLLGESQPLGRCAIVSYQPNKVVIEAQASRNCYLILLDSFYPGWQVWIDGRKGEILPANLLFRAVPLTEGKHTIVCLYRPRLFYLGLLISLGSFIAIIVVFIIKLRRKSI